MDISKVKKLLDLLEESTATEIEISSNDETIRISRNHNYAPPVPVAPAPIAVATAETPSAVATAHQVKSPMVGTYYSATSPEADDFVKIGDSVKVGDTLCIVEAMKIMNTIEADAAGTIKKVLLKPGDTVEFDQVLFTIT